MNSTLVESFDNDDNDKSFAVSDHEFRTAQASQQKRIFKVCVAVSTKPQGVAVRDSKDQLRKTLFFTNAEWAVFVDAVKKGEFDPIGGVEANLPR